MCMSLSKRCNAWSFGDQTVSKCSFCFLGHEHDAPYVDAVYYIICILSANFQNTRSESDNIGRYNITPVNN
jgi:hypothetical protein